MNVRALGLDPEVDGAQLRIKGSGHWPMDEAPGQVIPRLVAFFARK